jgi:hypothetical protein
MRHAYLGVVALALFLALIITGCSSTAGPSPEASGANASCADDWAPCITELFMSEPTTITVAWRGGTRHADKYIVRWTAKDPSRGDQQDYGTDVTRIAVHNVAAGEPYVFQVTQCIKPVGGESDCTDWSPSRSIVTPSCPNTGFDTGQTCSALTDGAITPTHTPPVTPTPPPARGPTTIGITSSPAAVSWGGNRVDFFERGADNAYYHGYWDGARWQVWEKLGGAFLTAPAVSSWAPGRLDVFGVGTDHAMWHGYWDGSAWQPWRRLGGYFTSAPAAVSWGPNRIDVFGRGGDNALWHGWWDGYRWSDFTSIGGSFTSGPAVTSWGPGRLDVFGIGGDSALWHSWWDGIRWNTWQSLSGYLTSDPAAVSWSVNRIDVFARGGNNAYWHTWWDGARWNPWESRDGAFTSGPATSSWASGRLDLFGVGADRALWHSSWSGGWGGWERVAA